MSSSKKKKKPPLFARIFFSKPSVTIMRWLAKGFLKLLHATLRITVHNAEIAKSASRGKLIIALWHDQLLLAPYLINVLPQASFCCVVSKSRDGRVLAAYANSLPKVSTILVGHQNRHGALLEMVQAIDDAKILLITPDGPRGPRHVAKEGILYCAKKANAKIVAMCWEAERAWCLNTWDKMQIPKPFSRVTIRFDLVPEATVSALTASLGN